MHNFDQVETGDVTLPPMTEPSNREVGDTSEIAGDDATGSDTTGNDTTSNAAGDSLPTIGVLGGTGPAGTALAARLASVGLQVLVGSRSKYRSMEAVDGVLERWPDLNLDMRACDNADAAQADLIIIATPWKAAAITARSVSEHLDGKIVVTMANALDRVGDEFVPLIPPRGSVAAHVQAVIPNARVAAAFQHVPAKELGHLDRPIDSDVLICSDSRAAAAELSKVVNLIPNFRALDCGELSNATAIEAFTAVLLQLNVRYRTRVALHLHGLPART